MFYSNGNNSRGTNHPSHVSQSPSTYTFSTGPELWPDMHISSAHISCGPIFVCSPNTPLLKWNRIICSVPWPLPAHHHAWNRLCSLRLTAPPTQSAEIKCAWVSCAHGGGGGTFVLGRRFEVWVARWWVYEHEMQSCVVLTAMLTAVVDGFKWNVVTFTCQYSSFYSEFEIIWWTTQLHVIKNIEINARCPQFFPSQRTNVG